MKGRRAGIRGQARHRRADLYREARARQVLLPGLQNLRDLGPIRVGWHEMRAGLLFRSDGFHDVPPGTIEHLRNVLGIKQAIDLRDEMEVTREPAPFADGSIEVAYSHVPVPTGAGALDGIAGAYRDILDSGLPALALICRLLLRPGGLPAIIYCVAGRDRTGVMVAAILSGMGVDRRTIEADYLLTLVSYDRSSGASTRRPTLSSHPIQSLLDHVSQRYGGGDGLMAEAGLTVEERESLRSALLK